MLPRVPEAASLRSLTVNFVAPVAPGAAQAEVDVLRSGKSATQVLATLRQEGAPVAVALGAFGAPRESAISVAATAEAPQLAAPETIEPFPYIAGMTPDFFQHLEMRLADGGFPYSGASTSHMDGWMRFRQAPPTFDIRHFVTLVDCWPPAVVQMLSELKPGSSMTWTLEIVDDVTAEPDTHWAYSVRTDTAEGGYAHTDARVWHPDGGSSRSAGRRSRSSARPGWFGEQPGDELPPLSAPSADEIRPARPDARVVFHSVGVDQRRPLRPVLLEEKATTLPPREAPWRLPPWPPRR